MIFEEDKVDSASEQCRRGPLLHVGPGVSVCQLCAMDKAGLSHSRRANHAPVPVVTATDTGQKAIIGRLKCKRHLQLNGMRSDKPWKYQACDVSFCLVVGRNCFLDCHKQFVWVFIVATYCFVNAEQNT